MKGLAKILKINQDKLIYNNICPDYSGIFGCSIFSYKGLIGRNYDWFANAIGNVSFGYVAPKGFYKFFYVNDGDAEVIKKDKNGIYLLKKSTINYIGGGDYINEKYLYIGLLYNPYKPLKMQFGLTSYDIMRKIAETCKNIKEVIETFKKIPCTHSQFFFISDPTKSIVIEHFGGYDYKIFKSTNDLLIHTNHILSKKYSKYNKKIQDESKKRYEIIKNACLEIKPKTLVDVKVILDKVFDFYKGKPHTIWQFLMNLERKEVYLLWKHQIYKVKL